MNEEITALEQENETLKKEKEELLEELTNCYRLLSEQIGVVESIKKELRRYEVKAASLAEENSKLKQKFSRIESTFIGRIMLKIYRWLREKRRRMKQKH